MNDIRIPKIWFLFWKIVMEWMDWVGGGMEGFGGGMDGGRD
jgi:hypothetical protein